MILQADSRKIRTENKSRKEEKEDKTAVHRVTLTTEVDPILPRLTSYFQIEVFDKWDACKHGKRLLIVVQCCTVPVLCCGRLFCCCWRQTSPLKGDIQRNGGEPNEKQQQQQQPTPDMCSTRQSSFSSVQLSRPLFFSIPVLALATTAYSARAPFCSC